MSRLSHCPYKIFASKDGPHKDMENRGVGIHGRQASESEGTFPVTREHSR